MKKILDVTSKLLTAISVFTGVIVFSANDVEDGGFLFLFKLIGLMLITIIASRLIKIFSEKL